jgi:hypothetical protein
VGLADLSRWCMLVDLGSRPGVRDPATRRIPRRRAAYRRPGNGTYAVRLPNVAPSFASAWADGVAADWHRDHPHLSSGVTRAITPCSVWSEPKD